jgi:sterol desaturase/sphingolipid hydroxylase (fatty acid hydroxylase superfamily)
MQTLLDSLTSTGAGATVALLVLFLAWETVRPFFGFFRGQAKERGVHLFRNLALAALNSAVVAIGFVTVWAGVAAWADARDFGLLHAWADAGAGRVVVALLILDASNYAWHRLCHAVPFLWRLHRVHHSDPRMDVSTAGRYHVGEVVLSSVLWIAVIALVGIRLWEMLLFELLSAAVAQFHHANISLPPAVDRLLRVFVVTPGMHRVHHSRLKHEMDSNFSSFLSVWDHLGRSYRATDRPQDIAFGLDRLDAPDRQTLTGLLGMPLARIPGPEGPSTNPSHAAHDR